MEPRCVGACELAQDEGGGEEWRMRGENRCADGLYCDRGGWCRMDRCATTKVNVLGGGRRQIGLSRFRLLARRPYPPPRVRDGS